MGVIWCEGIWWGLFGVKVFGGGYLVGVIWWGYRRPWMTVERILGKGVVLRHLRFERIVCLLKLFDNVF